MTEDQAPFRSPRLATKFPEGETVVSMIEHKGEIYVATTKRIYQKAADGTFKAMEIETASNSAS